MRNLWKEKKAAFIRNVMEEQMQSLTGQIQETEAREQDYLRRIKVLEENVRNNNALLDSLASDNRIERLEENVRNNNIVLEGLLAGNRIERLEENVRNNNALLDALRRETNSEMVFAKIEALKNDVRYLKEQAPKPGSAQITENNGTTVTVNEDKYDQIDYFSFENHFRGSEELIRQRQEMYLPYFESCGKVLDLGCGRGEFLEMLAEHDVQATGVDFYDEFAIYCRNKGLNVVTGDAVQYLKQLSEPVDGIFAGQLVEHLQTEQIVALCKYAYEKLESGKYLIIETPNPMSLAIYTHAFYIDPSHQKPVHPLTLKYFAEKAGFSDVQIVFTEASRLNEEIPKLQSDVIDNLDEFNQSMQRVSEYLYGSQDYAIIAKK